MLRDCADYDSMGNHGRFPMPKKIKDNLLKKIIRTLNKFFNVKRG